MAQPAFAQAGQGGTTEWTLIGPLAQVNVGTFTDISATYTMHYNSTTPVLGIGVAVLRNAQGQAVYYTEATTSLSYDQMGTMYFIINGAPAGSFTASVFVMDSAGVAVSNSSTVAVTV